MALGWFLIFSAAGDTAVIAYSCFLGVVSFGIMVDLLHVHRLSLLSVPGFCYLSYLATIFLPALWVFASEDTPSRSLYLFAVNSVLFTLPAGIAIANSWSRFDIGELRDFYARPIKTHRGIDLKLRYAFALALACGLAVSYVAEVRTIPLFQMFLNPGEAGALADLRDESLKMLDSPLRFLYHQVRDFLFPLLILLALGYFLTTRKTTWGVTFGLVTLLGLSFASLQTARFPPSSIIILIFLSLYVYRGGQFGRYSMPVIVITPVLFLSYPILVLTISGSTPVKDAIDTMMYRIFVSPASTLLYYFILIPDNIGFLYGRGMGSLNKLIGRDYYDMGHEVSRAINPTGGAGYGSANAAFISGLYADFGITGVLLGGILTGIAIQSIAILIVRRRKTVFTVSAQAMAIFIVSLLNILPIPSVLFFSGLPILVFALWKADPRSPTGREAP